MLAREAWEAALEALGAPGIDWTARRANLLVEGAALPRAAGGVVRIGAVVLEVTGQTSPCSRMEEVRPGLLRALAPDWRGGITCRVVEDGQYRARRPGGNPGVAARAQDQAARLSAASAMAQPTTLERYSYL